ncbi:FecR domain-containing protein [Pseudomonas aegrilactucae]|uniref:FecR domain-containing protein n=1 Tax=Pseudomonas aegrilactucae TaxID=2854028 RepID=A0A9Q2XJY7_9PSED|nr:FecR domain-containing protein [Pseudomonas aegrilactucae]MBV6287501.1 FecR domain-containing protein [Pseudomonas aegrilactucae]
MPRPDAPLGQAHVDQAIEWLVQLRYNTPSAQAEQRFQHWLERHPHNALAWAQVQAMSDEFSALPRDLSRRTLDGAQRRSLSRRDSLKLLGILGAAGTLGWVGRDQLGLPSLLADRHTATGERRSYHTADGSLIQLNTASAIDLRFDTDLRSLSLIQGEVAITTGNDPRPLRVTTRDGMLQARNSRLLVRERSDGTFLAVREGNVTLSAGNGTELRIAHPGEQLLLRANGHISPALGHVDPWGWSEGVLSVQQMPLGEFIVELSRYRPGVLRCADDVAGLKVFGTYQLADTDQILALIAQALPVRIDYRTRYWVSVSAV